MSGTGPDEPDPGPTETPPVEAGPAPDADPDDPLALARDVAESYRGTGAPARPRRRRARPVDPRRRSREDPGSVSEALGDLVRQQGWDSRLSAQRVFTDWATIVGAEVALHSQVVGYEDQVVHVRTDSTAWATQLRLLAPRIVARLNDELGDGSVVRIEVRGPQAPSWRRGARSVRGRGPRDTYG